MSKPLPANWSFAASQRTAPAATMGVLALALTGAGLLRLRGGAPAPAAKGWLDALRARRGEANAPRWAWARRPLWAVLATVGACLLAWRQPLWPWTGVAYAVCLLALVGAGMIARTVATRGGSGTVVQGTWAPSVAVGLVAGALGSPVAPMPVVRAPAQETRVAMAAPVTLAALSLVLLLESALLHVPLTTSLCLAAFTMAGSLLLPVEPLDGARAGTAGVIGAAGLLGAALLVGLGLR